MTDPGMTIGRCQRIFTPRPFGTPFAFQPDDNHATDRPRDAE
jgi:hypothetical protein